MEARYTIRTHPLLAECQGAPEMFEQVIPRLSTCMTPCGTIFPGQVAAPHATTSVCGLVSNLARNNVAAIAERLGHSRLPLHALMGWAAWDDAPWRSAWRRQVTRPVGPGDGVLGCEPSGCAKAGRESVGVARPWCGRLGTVDTCPVALDVGDVSSTGHTLVEQRLLLPTAWTQETARRDKAGVPNAYRASRTRHQLAWELWSTHGAWLPQSGRAGDDERGRPAWLRRRLAVWGERDLLAVPSHPALRDRDTAPPVSSGRGRPGQRPWHRVETWSPSLREASWQRIDVRAGRKGPVVVAAGKRRGVSRTHRPQQGDAETVVVLRSRDRDQHEGVQGEDSLSHAVPETPLGACARVATAAQRMAACLQRSKSAAGLADDAGRHGRGWQQQQTLSFLATWCLVRDTARGKKMAPCDHHTADAPRHRQDRARGIAMGHEAAQAQGVSEALATP